jgi:hypothetical protein
MIERISQRTPETVKQNIYSGDHRRAKKREGNMEDQEGFQEVGICGIFCGTCPYYLAHRKGDHTEMEKLSRESGLPVEEICCDGCLSDRLFLPCKECKYGFRQCAREHGVTWCFQCKDFPCQRLHDHLDIHVVNGISHHKHLIEYLQYMKEHGVEKWLSVQEKAGRCPECGTMLYWYSLECSNCQAKVQQPDGPA